MRKTLLLIALLLIPAICWGQSSQVKIALGSGYANGIINIMPILYNQSTSVKTYTLDGSGGIIVSDMNQGTNYSVFVCKVGGTGCLFTTIVPTGATQDISTALTSNPFGGGAQTVLTTKGDLLTMNGVPVLARLGVGTNGQVLTADSAQTLGIKWATPTTGVTTTGTPASGNLTEFSGPGTITNGDLSGDCSTTGTLTVTCGTAIARTGTDINTSNQVTNLSNVTNASLPFSGIATAALQGTDTKLLTSGTISGTSALLCTDANGGATTSSCPTTSSGVTTNNVAPGSDTISANGSFATTQAIAGNASVAGDVWDVWADGIETVNSGGAHQFTIKLGSTAITAATGFSISTGSNLTWTFHARIVFQAIGASGKVIGELFVNQQNAQGGNIALTQSTTFNIFDTAGNANSRIASLANAPITVDTTASIPITIAMTGFAASDTAQLNHVTFQKYH